MTPFSFDFEQHALTEEQMKELIYREALAFNPEYQNQWQWVDQRGFFDLYVYRWFLSWCKYVPSKTGWFLNWNIYFGQNSGEQNNWNGVCIGVNVVFFLLNWANVFPFSNFQIWNMRQWWVCKLQIIPLILRFLDDALWRSPHGAIIHLPGIFSGQTHVKCISPNI